MAALQTHSPVTDPATQDTLPDDHLPQQSNAERAVSDARRLEELPHSPTKAFSIYSPLTLGCIRVLRLQPARRLKDALVGTLDICCLNDGTQYEALSYTWGNTFINDKNPFVNDENPPFWIITDDDRQRYRRAFSTQPFELGEISLCGSALSIAANLCAALRRLRFSKNVRSLWIDALCINQDDADERSAQVAQIAQVFAHARQVIVWLGEDSGYRDGQFVFACCRKHQLNVHSIWRKMWRRALRHLSIKICHAIPSHPKSKFFWEYWDKQPLVTWTVDKQDRQFRLFNARRYFSRLWCVQEVASADKVIVKRGGSEVSWATYRSYIIQESTLSWCALVELPAITGASMHTLATLVECSGLQCSDERDYIYAISSLLKLCGDCPRIQIDYRLDWQTVFTNFARDYVMLNGYTAAWSILIVAASRSNAELPSSMPSWVPDWRPAPSGSKSERPIRRSSLYIADDEEQECRAAGRSITVAFDDRSMTIDLWYHGLVGEGAKSPHDSDINLSTLHNEEFKSGDCLYSLPPEHLFNRIPCLILRRCAGQKSVFQLVAVVRLLHWEWRDIVKPCEEEMHRVSII